MSQMETVTPLFKLLKLSKRTQKDASSGKVLNLFTSDATRIELSQRFCYYIIVSPLQLAVVVCIGYIYVGVPSLSSLIYVLIAVSMVGISKGSVYFRKKSAMLTDKRLRLMNEIVSAIHVVKMYVWEKKFAQQIKDARKSEVNRMIKTDYLKTVSVFVFGLFYKVVVCFMLITIVVTGDIVSTAEIFLVISLLLNVNQAITLSFGTGAVSLSEAFYALQRGTSFLLLEEKNDSLKHTCYDVLSTPQVNNNTEVISAHIAAANWDSGNQKETLNNINLSLKPGSLTIIAGSVGSGKSSIFEVLLGELPCLSTESKIKCNGRISYASQEPWIFTGTVRENIIFGSEYKKKNYDETIRICALEKDIAELPHGDRSLVGEKGIKLSGGQKARVSLARAVYHDGDIFLLDDPLSAVDVNVGRYLFEECIKKHLRSKAVILATHQLQYLNGADYIIMINNGSTETEGSTQYLLQNEDFCQLVKLRDKYLNCGTDENDKESPGKERLQTNSKVTSQYKADTSTRQHGNITLFFKYLGAGSSICFLLLLFVTGPVYFLTNAALDYYLKIWCTSINNYSPESSQASIKELQYYHLAVYGGLVAVSSVAMFGYMITFNLLTRKSSRSFHDKMFNAVLRAPMKFFESNAIGLILNRFSKDIGDMDDLLALYASVIIRLNLENVMQVVVIAVIKPTMLIPGLVLLICGCIIWWYSVYSIDMLKQVETQARSPLYTHLDTSIKGMGIIRAYRNEEKHIEKFNKLTNSFTSATLLLKAASQFMNCYIGIAVVLFLTAICFTYVMISGNSTTLAVDAGVSLTSILVIALRLKFSFQLLMDLQTFLISVDRVIGFTKLEGEDQRELKECNSSWPEKGSITFKSLNIKYNPDDPPVVKNFSFSIASGQKVGVVGRTGAGKSSLTRALFQTVDYDGSILIDGVDTKDIPLNRVRSAISIIPQDPSLFNGTIRDNLDPFHEFSDDVLWEALNEIKLTKLISHHEGGLDANISEGGCNFSTGEKQLICTARAVLKKSRIIVLDEATANVDNDTDAIMQQFISTRFKDCTVLTIAHRLNTIMDYDVVLIIDNGVLLESGCPRELLKNNQSEFSKLVHGSSSKQKQNDSQVSSNEEVNQFKKRTSAVTHLKQTHCYENKAFESDS